MSRKTVDIVPFVDWANHQLSRTDEFADQGFKSGVCVMIERALFEANAYSGFSFLTEDNEVGTPDYWSRHYYLPLELR